MREYSSAAVPAYGLAVTSLCGTHGIGPDKLASYRTNKLAAKVRRLVAMALYARDYNWSEIASAMGIHRTTAMRLGSIRPTKAESAILDPLCAVLPYHQGEIIKTFRDGDTDEDGKDYGRERWESARESLRETIPALRDAKWRELAKQLYPHSWQRQAAQLPGGIQ